MRIVTLSPAERRRWAGIALGALTVDASFVAKGPTYQRDLFRVLLAATFTGVVVAGALSNGGVRAGGVSGFLSGIFGFGVSALWLLARIVTEHASRPGGNDFVAGLALILLLLTGAAILVVALAG